MKCPECDTDVTEEATSASSRCPVCDTPIGEGYFTLMKEGEAQGHGFVGWRDNSYVCEYIPVKKGDA